VKKARSHRSYVSPQRKLKTPLKNIIPWTKNETSALVEFIALHKSEQHDTNAAWPKMNGEHPYWKLASEYIIKETGALYANIILQ